MRTISLALLLAAAQTAQPPAQPTFDARAEVVLVDVSVLDGEGRPVEGLTAADFDLVVNGQPRAIQNVQYLSTLGVRSETSTPREQQFTGNDGAATGRVLLFVVDEFNLRADGNRGVLTTAGRVLDVLGPGDPVGLARLPGGGGVGFTTDHQRVRRALAQVRGRLPSRNLNRLRLSEAWAFESGDRFTWDRVLERECSGETGLGLFACQREQETIAKGLVAEAQSRSLQTLNALEQLVARLITLRAPINVIMISEGLFLSRDVSLLGDFARRAAESRVTIHVVQPGESMFDADKAEIAGSFFREDDLLGEGLSILAGQTRGAHYKINISSGAGAFERLRREISGYYLLAFEPSDADRTVRDRRIRVEVKRKGLTVRARSTYALTSSAAGTGADAPPEQQIKDLLAAPLHSSGLPMRVATYATANVQDGRVRVIVAAEIGEHARDAAEWPVGILVLDKDDNFVVNSIGPMKLAPASARTESPRLMVNAFTVPPGEYTLRLAAVAPDGRSGSVYHTIDARLRPLGDRVRASDLLVAVPPANASDAPRPTPSMLIDGPSLAATLELTGEDMTRVARTRVVFEIAASETGPALLQGETRQTPRASGAVRSFGATIRTELLPPGEYVVRAVVHVPEEKPALFTHAFRVTGAAATTTATAPAPAAPASPAPALPPAPRIIAPVPGFAVEEVLRPDVVNGFLDALQQRHPVSAATAPIVAQARRGTFAAPTSTATPAEDEPTLAFIRGLGALEKRQLAQASAWFQLALKGASDFLGAAFYLGAVHAATGSDQAAVAAWQMSLIGDGGERAYPALVDALLRTGDAQAALDFIAEAPGAWRDDRARRRRVAIAQAMLGQYEAALEGVTALLEREPDDGDLLFIALQVMYRRQTDHALLDRDRPRFFDYARRYQRIGGAHAALVQSWVAALSR